MGMINQDDIARIMNAVNDAINDFGYIAVGYENTKTFLNIVIEHDDSTEEGITVSSHDY